MKCKCSLNNNNYQVIGLCDIEKFNEKIKNFKDNSWTQITLPEKLKIPSNKASVKSITKVYLDIQITSTKIIKTPTSDMPNVESLKVTGRLLLVSGEICQNIIYISDSLYSSVHSIKFRVPFSTYIIIDKNANSDKDNYCIYPCVEDVFVNILDERTLSKSVTLFLFAHKTTPIIEKLQNAFVFKNSSNQEMAMVELDGNNKRLIVTSTGDSYGGGAGQAFKFQLLDDEKAIRKSSIINQNGNANEFKDALNEADFEFGDFIKIEYNDKTKVKLSNHPNEGDEYDMRHNVSQSFRIMEDKIIPNVLPNSIILNGADNNPVVTTEFDDLTKGVLVKSTGNVTEVGGADYFKMTLSRKDVIRQISAFALIELKSESIRGNSNGDAFANSFLDQIFRDGDILGLKYENPQKIKITNFPNEGQTYTPTGTEEKFELNGDSVTPYNSNLKNKIIIKSKDDREVATIEFNKDDKKFVVNSTGVIPDSTLNESYFTLTLKNQVNNSDILTATLNCNENASNFKRDLNDRNFTMENRLIISYKDNSKIEITNFPNVGNKYIPKFTSDILKITDVGLADVSYPNKIRVFDDNNAEVSMIHLFKNASNTLMFATSTGITSTNQVENNKTYVELLNYLPSGVDTRGEILGKTDASNFVSAINNNKPIQLGKPIRLYNKIQNRISITNYKGNDEYRIGEEHEFLKLDGNKLIQYGPTYNRIKVKNPDGKAVLFIYFDKIDSNTIYVEPYSTGITYTGTANSMNIKIFKDTVLGRELKFEAQISKNQSVSQFQWANPLPGNIKQIEFGDILEFLYRDSSSIEVSKFPNTSNNFTLVGNRTTFTINPGGLTQLIKKLPNTITIKSINDEEVAKIEFNSDSGVYMVSSTGIIPNQTATIPYFTFIETNSDGTITYNSATLNSNESADNFKNNLNNKVYRGASNLILICENPSKIEITNYPQNGQNYTLTLPINSFKLDEVNGLKNLDDNLKHEIKVVNDRNQEMTIVKIYKRLTYYNLFSIYTDFISTNAFENNYIYAQFVQYSFEGVQLETKILGKSNAFEFSNALNNFKISAPAIGSIKNAGFMRLYNKISNKITISNYKNQPTYTIGEEPEFLEFDNNTSSLIPHNMNYNKIIFKNNDNSYILFIYFDKINLKEYPSTGFKNYMQVYSTRKPNNDSDSFSFEILDSNEQPKNPSIKGIINKGENGESINISSDSSNITQVEWNDILELKYSNPNLVEVFQIDPREPKFNLTGASQKFIIAESGLKLLNYLTMHEILINGQSGIWAIRIRFKLPGSGITKKELDCEYVNSAIYPSIGNADYFVFTLSNSTGVDKTKAIIKGNETPQNLRNQLQDKPFEYGDIVTLNCSQLNKVTISNFGRFNNTYTLTRNEEKFIITENGLISKP